MLVEAFAKFCYARRDTETHLIVAGPDDGQGRELRETAIRLGVQERVTFTGYLDQKQKIEALVDSSLVVIPSRSEVFAITAVEALMCSRPVLLSSACGLYPAPDESHGVRLFDSTSVEDLTSKLQGALNDAELFAAARNGRDFVLREFSLEEAVVKLESVYQSIGADKWR